MRNVDDESTPKGDKAATDPTVKSFWNVVDNYRAIARDPNADDETRLNAAERFFSHESMERERRVILSSLRRGKNSYECGFVGDTLNEIQLRVMKGIADFRGGCEASFWGWLWQIVRHTSISSSRQLRKESPLADDDILAVERVSTDNPLNGVLLKEWLEKLSNLQRFILEQRAEGYVYKEIAECVGLSISHTQREATTAQKTLAGMMLGRTPPRAASSKIRKKPDNLKGEERDEK